MQGLVNFTTAIADGIAVLLPALCYLAGCSCFFFFAWTLWTWSQPHRHHAESARGVSPRAAPRSGRDTLASSGSCPRTKTAAFRREMRALPVVSWPALNVGDLPPLLHGHYPASLLLQSSPPLPAASVLSASQVRCLCLFPWHRWTGSQVPYESPNESHAY